MAETNTPPSSDANIPPAVDPGAVPPPPAPAPSPAPTPDPAPTPAPAPAPVATRPDYIPEAQWDAETGKPKVDIAALLQRAGEVPAEAAGYVVDLPADSPVKIDPADPLLAAARDVAKEHGFTQAQFAAMVGLRVKMEAGAIEASNAAAQAELGKLGDKAPERISTVTQFLEAKLPKAQFDAIRGAVTSAAGVEAVESLMQLAGGTKLPSQPAGSTNSAADTLAAMYPSMKKGS